MQVSTAVEMVLIQYEACCYAALRCADELRRGHDEVVDGAFGAQTVHEGLDVSGSLDF